MLSVLESKGSNEDESTTCIPKPQPSSSRGSVEGSWVRSVRNGEAADDELARGFDEFLGVYLAQKSWRK